MCLVTSTHTIRMHSQSWRAAYKRRMPAGYKWATTDRTKRLPRAHKGRAVRCGVALSPIRLASVASEVHSTEFAKKHTPLLLSIQAMVACGARSALNQNTCAFKAFNKTAPAIRNQDLSTCSRLRTTPGSKIWLQDRTVVRHTLGGT